MERILRYIYISKETIVDMLAWGLGYSKEQIDEELAKEKYPLYYDKQEKQHIDVAEYNRRMTEDIKHEN